MKQNIQQDHIANHMNHHILLKLTDPMNHHIPLKLTILMCQHMLNQIVKKSTQQNHTIK